MQVEETQAVARCWDVNSDLEKKLLLSDTISVVGGLGSRSDVIHQRGKSELLRAGCWVIPRRSNPTESATETNRLGFLFLGKGEIGR